MKYQLEKDEEIVYAPKLCLWDKVILSIVVLMFLVITLSGLFLVAPYGFVYPILAYIGVNFLTGKVVVTNKRIIFQNIFFLTQSIYLKDIKSLKTLTKADLLFESGAVSVKIKDKFFSTNIYVPDRSEFYEKVLELIINSIPENNLDEKLVEKYLQD